MNTRTDIRTLTLDSTLPQPARLEYVGQELRDPCCFCYDSMGIQLEFDENAPPLEEVLANLLIRQKSGL